MTDHLDPFSRDYFNASRKNQNHVSEADFPQVSIKLPMNSAARNQGTMEQVSRPTGQGPAITNSRLGFAGNLPRGNERPTRNSQITRPCADVGTSGSRRHASQWTRLNRSPPMLSRDQPDRRHKRSNTSDLVFKPHKRSRRSRGFELRNYSQTAKIVNFAARAPIQSMPDAERCPATRPDDLNVARADGPLA